MATTKVATQALDERSRLLMPTERTKSEGRCVQQGRSLGQFAVVALVLAPVAGQNGVSLDNECQPVDQSGASYQGDGIDYFRRGITSGIDNVLEHYHSLGFNISGLIVTIDRMVVHPIDSTEGAFRVAARNAFASGLLGAGLTPSLQHKQMTVV